MKYFNKFKFVLIFIIMMNIFIVLSTKIKAKTILDSFEVKVNSSVVGLNSKTINITNSEDIYEVSNDIYDFEKKSNSTDIVFIIDVTASMDSNIYYDPEDNENSNITTGINPTSNIIMNKGWVSKMNSIKKNLNEFIDTFIENEENQGPSIGLISYGGVNTTYQCEVKIDSYPTDNYELLKRNIDSYTPKHEIQIGNIYEDLAKCMSNMNKSSEEKNKETIFIMILNEDNVKKTDTNYNDIREQYKIENENLYLMIDKNLGELEIKNLSDSLIGAKEISTDNVTMLSEDDISTSICKNKFKNKKYKEIKEVVKDIYEKEEEHLVDMTFELNNNASLNVLKDSIMINLIENNVYEREIDDFKLNRDEVTGKEFISIYIEDLDLDIENSKISIFYKMGTVNREVAIKENKNGEIEHIDLKLRNEQKLYSWIWFDKYDSKNKLYYNNFIKGVKSFKNPYNIIVESYNEFIKSG